MIGEVKDLTGRKYGRLTVVEQHGFTEKNKHGSRQAIWYCKCDCGNYCEMPSGTLTIGTMIEDCDFQKRMNLFGDERIDKPGWIRWRELLEAERNRRT